jgi:hypothetical protein
MTPSTTPTINVMIDCGWFYTYTYILSIIILLFFSISVFFFVVVGFILVSILSWPRVGFGRLFSHYIILFFSFLFLAICCE